MRAVTTAPGAGIAERALHDVGTVTRCGGYTGWLRGAALAQAAHLEVYGHCAPSLHAPVAAAVPNLRHVEWFVDHARLEPLLVAGAPIVRGGELQVDTDTPGHGMNITAEAEQWLTS
jgi:L-alanine-DL-glutamate epimerase-like enolase superfamily enzyme